MLPAPMSATADRLDLRELIREHIAAAHLLMMLTEDDLR